MLFNSYLFIFIFLPIVWIGFHSIKYYAHTHSSPKIFSLAKLFLVLSSLFFYAYWKFLYLPILLGSIVINFIIAKTMLASATRAKAQSTQQAFTHSTLDSTMPACTHASRLIGNKTGGGGGLSLKQTYTLSAKTLLIIGIIFNLCLLGIFKYTDFFLENFNLFTKLLHLDFAIPLPHILLPLALSFVTFQQIAFLVDCYKQAKEREEAKRLESNGENNGEYQALESCTDISTFTKTQYDNKKVDSTATQNTSKQVGDSRIFDEKCGLQGKSQGSYLKGNDCRDFSQLPHLSQKAKSPKEIPHINFLDYCLFITFFPQLIAGPIVHHREMMPQFHAMNRRDSVSGEPLSLRGDAIAEAIHTKTQKLDSSMDSKETSANAERCPLFSKEATLCHADKSARNDTNLSKPAKDSRVFTQEVQNVAKSQAEAKVDSSKSLSDSKILDEKCGLQAKAQGSYLSGNDRRAFMQLPHFSLKAESQTQKPTPSIINWEYIAKGLFIFSIGLFKKVVIADSFAKWANAGFSAVESGSVLNLLESWATSLSYTFQLYFDFSGYCDMAIGLGLLFGIVLPLNFSSPYKSRNIAEFWRRWHITLGRFLKEYLYIPLGGNRNTRRIVSKNGEPAIQKKESWFNNLLTLRNLFIVAFLSGVWHGAGWGFVLWGSLHGLAMVGHRAYMFMLDWAQQSSQRAKIFVQTLLESKLYIVLCWFLTFNFVNIAWVFFRAENLQGALNLLKGMFFGSLVLPKSLESRLGEVVNLSFGLWLEGIKGDFTIVVWILGAFALCLVCRNSVEITKTLTSKLYYTTWSACMLTFSLLYIGGNAYTPFLYFNF